MEIIKMLKLADYLTLAGTFCGIVSMVSSVTGNMPSAAAFLFIALLFDAVDGRIARARKSSNDFGRELDSLSDVVAFGAAPAVFGFALGLTDGLSIIVIGFFALCGAMRLARFNVKKLDYFEGAPITTNGIVIPVFYMILKLSGISYRWMLAAYGLMGISMVSTVRIKKC